MSVPPPPGQWGSQAPAAGQPIGPQQWGPQQRWGPPPVPPQGGGGKGKWIFGGIALLAVIAVTVVITVLVVGKNSGRSPDPTPTSTPPSDIASANDKGPATIITEDPTCAATTPILQTLSDVGANGWNKRDVSVPSSAWSPDVRSQYEA